MYVYISPGYITKMGLSDHRVVVSSTLVDNVKFFIKVVISIVVSSALGVPIVLYSSQYLVLSVIFNFFFSVAI